MIRTILADILALICVFAIPYMLALLAYGLGYN
jgi:hypothetical protein